MAKARKSVLGDNPFASESKGDTAPSGSTEGRGSPAAERKSVRKGEARDEGAARAGLPKVGAKRGGARKKPAARGVAPAQVADPLRDPEREPSPRATASGQEDEGRRRRAARRRELAAQVHDLESRMASLDDAAVGQPTGQRGGGPVMGLEAPGGGDGGMFDAARELLSSDYYLRQWGRLGMRNRSETVDDFGHDPKYDARLQPWFDALYERYFRTVTEGIENVPSEGSALIVVNHAGTFPYDGLLLKTALRREHPSQRELRWLAEDHLFYMPFVGSFLNRMGAVRACQENAERLLRQRQLVAVFPEGSKGTGRLYRDRHKLQRFGRGGFVRLCLRTGTPVIPCVIVGGEESMPLLFRIEYLANVFGIPYIPITPTFPALGPLGVLPAPARWSFTFGDPIPFEGYDPDAADDHVLVGRLTERVRATMQGMIDRTVHNRRSVWFG